MNTIMNFTKEMLFKREILDFFNFFFKNFIFFQNTTQQKAKAVKECGNDLPLHLLKFAAAILDLNMECYTYWNERRRILHCARRRNCRATARDAASASTQGADEGAVDERQKVGGDGDGGGGGAATAAERMKIADVFHAEFKYLEKTIARNPKSYW